MCCAAIDISSYLMQDRGLAPSTAVSYSGTAGLFLSERALAGGGEGGVESLRGADVTGFLLRECSRLALGSAKNRVNHLRSLLRFLRLEGVITTDLAAAVPPVAGWRDTGLPATLTAGEVAELLSSCDRSLPTGLRDFAILTLLARLGLRSCEVAGLELDDIDWRGGELFVRGKGRGEDPLPLLNEVGEALAAYLHDGRPEAGTRAVFLTSLAPVRGLRPASVGHVVRRGASGRDGRRWGRTGCVMRWPPRCCAEGCRWSTSARSCAIVTWPPRRCTRRSTLPRCAPSPRPGRGPSDERAVGPRQ